MEIKTLEDAKKLDFAIFFANGLRKYLIEDEVDIENWDINIDKILENIDEVKKLNPTKKLKFLEFIHDKKIVTPNEKGKKKLDEIVKKINSIRK